MNQLIACALCAGEIKKVGFQVNASVNASAANFPIPSIYSRSRFTLAISIITTCFCPCADNRCGYKRPKCDAYVWAGNNACELLCGRRDIVSRAVGGILSFYIFLPREVFIILLGDFIKAIKITLLSRAIQRFEPNCRRTRERIATENFN